MSKKLYIGALVSSLGLFLLLLISAIVYMRLLPVVSIWVYENLGVNGWQNVNILIIALVAISGVLFLIVNIVVTFTLIRRMWASIQDGHARTTPGKAIGFLFIPVFNLYWIFQVWGGFPQDYNNYVERHRLQVPLLASGIYIAHAVLILLSVIPFLNILTVIIGYFVFLMMTARTCDAINNLSGTAQERQNVQQFSMQNPIFVRS
jgi:hypothetical protein